MAFTTYWSILETPAYTFTADKIGFTVFSLGLLSLVLVKKYKIDSGDGDKNLILFGLGMFSFLGLFMFVLSKFVYTESPDKRIIDMVNSTETPKVVGYIENFERYYRRHKGGVETTVSFTVAGVPFSYSDAFLSGFRSFTKTKGSKIISGQYVRITYMVEKNYIETYTSNTILKIEIRWP